MVVMTNPGSLPLLTTAEVAICRHSVKGKWSSSLSIHFDSGSLPWPTSILYPTFCGIPPGNLRSVSLEGWILSHPGSTIYEQGPSLLCFLIFTLKTGAVRTCQLKGDGMRIHETSVEWGLAPHGDW